MCGIAGQIKTSGSIDEGELLRMRDALEHRGPDDKGFWIGADGKVGLAHRRLSIIDLSEAGRQPMANDDGTLLLVFNGEIYNFRELRQTLEEKGHVFRSQTDSEVILHAYEEWGIEAVARLNGMFAFALYDRARRRVVLARDRFGEKPLYYAVDRGVFYFASELKALRTCGDLSLGIDREKLYPYLVFGYTPYPDTIFAGVFKLPPASIAVVDVESLDCSVTEYWDPRGSGDAGDAGNLEEAVDRMDALFSEAVGMRLMADVPVGAFLSGGVDSSLIVSAMTRHQAKVKTFAIGFWDGEYDEAPYAKAIAAHLGCEHREYYVEPQEAIDVLMGLPAIYDEPFADSSAIPTCIVSRFAREEVKVVLTGDGADELFGGYTVYPLFARLRHVQRLPRMARSLAAAMAGAIGSGKWKRHADLLRQGELWELFLYLNERTVTKPPDAARILPGVNEELADSEFARIFRREQGRDSLQAAMSTEAGTYLVDDILTKVDRASMAVSLEARVPFLDHRIAEFAAGLSSGTKMGRGGQERKRVLYSLLGRYLPRELFERKKHGFAVPLHRWFRGDLRWLLHEYLDKGRIKREGVFDAEVVGQMVTEHLSGARDREAVLWALVFWQMWREEWKL
jgi:asparagine synthase (glutamine-hydrolysing)